MRKNKKEKNILSLKERLKVALVLIGLFIPIFVYIFFNYQERNELLQNDSFKTIAFIEQLSPNQRKGGTTSQDVIYFKFLHNDTIIHEIHSTMVGTISGHEMRIGDAYELTVANSDVGIYKLNFNSRKDSVSYNLSSNIHKYRSDKHRKMVKNRK